MATHEEIEGRTKAEVIEILKRNNVPRKSGYGYSLAKKLCFEGKFINTDIYDKQIAWIINYLGY